MSEKEPDRGEIVRDGDLPARTGFGIAFKTDVFLLPWRAARVSFLVQGA
jgi:hypothetical protein